MASAQERASGSRPPIVRHMRNNRIPLIFVSSHTQGTQVVFEGNSALPRRAGTACKMRRRRLGSGGPHMAEKPFFFGVMNNKERGNACRIAKLVANTLAKALDRQYQHASKLSVSTDERIQAIHTNCFSFPNPKRHKKMLFHNSVLSGLRTVKMREGRHRIRSKNIQTTSQDWNTPVLPSHSNLRLLLSGRSKPIRYTEAKRNLRLSACYFPTSAKDHSVSSPLPLPQLLPRYTPVSFVQPEIKKEALPIRRCVFSKGAKLVTQGARVQVLRKSGTMVEAEESEEVVNS